MQNLTTQRHCKKSLCPVKYCMSKESVQQTVNSKAIANIFRGYSKQHRAVMG